MIKILFAHYTRVLAHKAWVYYYGRKLGVGRCQLLIHDLSKFKLDEAIPYARNFFGPANLPKDRSAFFSAFSLHCARNPHHFQYWQKSPMPYKFVFEMLADHLAASRAYEGEAVAKLSDWDWLNTNWVKMTREMHSTSISHYLTALMLYFGETQHKAFVKKWYGDVRVRVHIPT